MSKQSLINSKAERTTKDLQRLQALPLEQKVNLSLRRIRDFINKCGGDTYISFSGGKDSTVLLDLVRQIDPNIKAVFADTGLEFPEIKEFIRSIDNVEWVYPKMSFKQVIDTYGYPLIGKKTARKIREIKYPKETNAKTVNLYSTGVNSKGEYKSSAKISEKWRFLTEASFDVTEKCCDIMKKKPFASFERVFKKKNNKNIYPFIGVMAGESQDRESAWKKNGCNAFEGAKKQSRPLMFWNDLDVWEYIKSRNLPYSKIYDMGYKRTGCVFCGFGAHLESQPNRFQLLEQTHPKLYDYCMEKKGDYGLGMKKPLEIIGVETKYQPSLFENGEFLRGEG